MTTYNVAEAKTHLSRLIDAAVGGEEVTLARAGRPLARIVPVQPPPEREMGFLPLDVPDEFFESLSDGDLAAWS